MNFAAMFARIGLQRKAFSRCAGLLLCITLPAALAGQAAVSTPNGKDFRFGFRISPNFSWVKALSEEVNPNGLGLGFSYGLMGDFQIRGNYAFATEITVTSMRSKFAHSDTLVHFMEGVNHRYTGVEFDYALQYVQIPLTLKMRTNEIGKFYWWGQFGIAPGILLSNTLRTTSNPEYIDGKYTPNATDRDFNGENGPGVFKDNISVIRIPMVLGFGAEYRINGSTMLNMGLRFDNGITDFLRDKKATGRNNFLALQVGVFF
jgi:hypothetical protein